MSGYGWRPIPEEKTATFAAEPKPQVIPKGDLVYRVVGKHPRFKTNLYPGEFWSLKPPGPTEQAWRAGSAVVGEWNGDGGYIEHQLTDDVHAWVGPAGPQNSQVDGYILPGGDTQVWVPEGTINPLKGGVSKMTCTKKSPWNIAKS